jgi:peptidoglycan glycosyltransferase
MDRPAGRLLLFFALLFVALIVQLTYVQVYAAPDLREHPRNTRAIEEEMRVERGLIFSADGQQLAENRQEGEYFLRNYPQANLVSPWIGYNSIRYGRAGVERVYNDLLAGNAQALTVRNYLDLLTGRPQRGADLHLTIDTRVQQAATQALGERAGAVVALEPSTGAVLALVSFPRYDPNTLEEDWEALNQDPGRPLLNRAIQGVYPPGSSFKPLVAAAGLTEGTVAPDTRFVDEGTYVAGGYEVHNYGDAVYGEHDFTEAMAQSINTTFAKVGVELGEERLRSYASEFGFGEEVPFPLGVATGNLPEEMDTAHVAQVSFGQGELLATPLQMALLAAGIANGGRIMEPYLLLEARDYEQAVVEQTQPRVWREPVPAQVAAQVRDMMVQVVSNGTGTAAQISGVQVAGKTGTAEVDQSEPHAWFIGFAPAQDPQVAVAVVVENGGTGGSTAAPVAQAVMAAALAR